ncbi:MAG: hypothetical protein U0T31_03115 [Chitinophagales bacterium]
MHSHPCLIVQIPSIPISSTTREWLYPLYPKNKKESKDRGLTKAHAHGLQG